MPAMPKVVGEDLATNAPGSAGVRIAGDRVAHVQCDVDRLTDGRRRDTAPTSAIDATKAERQTAVQQQTATASDLMFRKLRLGSGPAPGCASGVNRRPQPMHRGTTIPSQPIRKHSADSKPSPAPSA